MYPALERAGQLVEASRRLLHYTDWQLFTLLIKDLERLIITSGYWPASISEMDVLPALRVLRNRHIPGKPMWKSIAIIWDIIVYNGSIVEEFQVGQLLREFKALRNAEVWTSIHHSELVRRLSAVGFEGYPDGSLKEEVEL